MREETQAEEAVCLAVGLRGGYRPLVDTLPRRKCDATAAMVKSDITSARTAREGCWTSMEEHQEDIVRLASTGRPASQEDTVLIQLVFAAVLAEFEFRRILVDESDA